MEGCKTFQRAILIAIGTWKSLWVMDGRMEEPLTGARMFRVIVLNSLALRKSGWPVRRLTCESVTIEDRIP